MREYIDENYIYGELKLWKSARKNNAVGVLVEAKTDELFYRPYFSKNTSFFKTGGFPKLQATFDKIEKNKDKGFIGIIDADFKRIDNESIKYHNLFLSDGHDIEMMTINSPAWEQVLDFHIDKKKIYYFEKKHNKNIKDYLFDIAKSIACVRYLNNKEKIGLVFRTFKKNKPDFIDYQKFVNKEDLSFDYDEMLKTIENKSSKQNFFKTNNVHLIELNNIQKKQYDLLEFCNGHDITNLLALALRKAIGNTTIKGTDIENQLIIAYRFDDFKTTNLYKELLAWEQTNKNFKLFDNKQNFQ